MKLNGVITRWTSLLSLERLQPTLLTAHAFRSDVRDSCFELFLPPNSISQYEFQTEYSQVRDDSILDGIIVNDQDKKEHYSWSEKVIKRLEERGSTKAPVQHGRVLSGTGIGYTAEKLKVL